MVAVSSFQRKSLAGGLHLQRVKRTGYGWSFQTFFTELHPENRREAAAAEDEEFTENEISVEGMGTDYSRIQLAARCKPSWYRAKRLARGLGRKPDS